MLAEFAITPKALRPGSYADPDLARICLARLFDCLRNEAVTRDIGGKWQASLEATLGKYHPMVRELVEYLKKHGRIVKDELAQPGDVGSDQDWLALAKASHKKAPLDLIVTRLSSQDDSQEGSPISDIVSVDSSNWWKNRSESIHVKRSLDGYIRALRLIATTSRKLVFIDPYLNLTKPPYAEFPSLLAKLAELNEYLFFEIHISKKECPTAGVGAFAAGLKAISWRGQLDLHVWESFHDRYILSNLIGIAIPKGLETTQFQIERSLIWARLSQGHREKIAREYDPLTQQQRYLKHFPYSHP